MGAKYEKLMASMQAELDGNKPVETPVEDKPEDTPAVEDKPNDDTPAVEDKPGDKPDDKPTDDDKPADDDKPGEDKPAPAKRDIPDDPVKRAEFAFKRQLQKKDEKHAKELADRDAKYDKLLKEIEEMKKSMKPDEPIKRREDFEDDEDFINYLLEKGMEKGFAKRDEEQAKKAAEQAEKDKAREEEKRQLQETQTAWLNNVNEAFGGDKERANTFLSKIQYANNNGLGEILDNCPVASDFLMNDPMGPVVFEKILSDKQTFDKVFDMRRLTPLNIFYQLKRVEEELSAPAIDPTPAVVKQTMPHLGKPGKQAAGSSMTNNDMFSDPRAIKKWLREHR